MTMKMINNTSKISISGTTFISAIAPPLLSPTFMPIADLLFVAEGHLNLHPARFRKRQITSVKLTAARLEEAAEFRGFAFSPLASPADPRPRMEFRLPRRRHLRI